MVEDDGQFIVLRIGDVWQDDGNGGPKQVPSPGSMFSAWQANGAEGMKIFDGCWSLVVCDLHRETALVITDRFNSHPIYWSTDGSVWSIGTTVQTAAIGRRLPIKLDAVAIFQFMHFTRLFGTRTIVEGVQVTRPGSWLELGGRAAKGGTWFSFEYTDEVMPKDYWAEALADAFSAAVRNVIIPGSTSLLLSGGLDSRMVLASTDIPIDCLHVNDFFNREAQTAQALADLHGSRFRLVRRPLDHYIRIRKNSAAIASAGYSFHHAHCLGLLKLPDDHAVIHGWAPELYFRGTTLPRRYVPGLGIRSPFVERITSTNLVEQMFRNLQYSQYTGRPFRVFRRELHAEYRSALYETMKEVVAEAKNHSDHPLDWYLWPDTYYQARYPSHLWSISLRTEHRERSVTMQNKILDLHLRMPIAMRSNNEVWLAALSRLNPKIAEVPDANTGYRPSFSSAAYLFIKSARWGHKRARKILGLPAKALVGGHEWFTEGSWPDITTMFADYPAFHDDLCQSALNQHLPDSLFDAEAVSRLFDDVRSERDWRSSQILLAASTVATWVNQFGRP